MNELHRLLIELHYEIIKTKNFYNNNNNKKIMSYLAQQTSNTEFGVVKIGDNILCSNGPDLIAGPGISIVETPNSYIISANGADLIHVFGTTSNYTLTANDEYVGVSSASAVTITLPSGTPGRVYTIKDEYGQGSGKITIQPQTGESIDGKTNYVISVPYQAVNTVYRANSWWII